MTIILQPLTYNKQEPLEFGQTMRFDTNQKVYYPYVKAS